MAWLLDLLFRREDITGVERCPYLQRWIVVRCGRRWSLYIHRFIGDDWSNDLHDHPKRFVSIGLWGGYDEETPCGVARFRAPWVRSFPAVHRHRVRLATPVCWTVVWTGRYTREWGFWPSGRWVKWDTYVHGSEMDPRDGC